MNTDATILGKRINADGTFRGLHCLNGLNCLNDSNGSNSSNDSNVLNVSHPGG
jgi:hypothetical protein